MIPEHMLNKAGAWRFGGPARRTADLKLLPPAVRYFFAAAVAHKSVQRLVDAATAQHTQRAFPPVGPPPATYAYYAESVTRILRAILADETPTPFGVTAEHETLREIAYHGRGIHMIDQLDWLTFNPLGEDAGAWVGEYAVHALPSAGRLLGWGTVFDMYCQCAGNDGWKFDPAWRTEQAVRLATKIVENNAPGELPTLAWELQNAGCSNGDIYTETRNPSMYSSMTFGVWAVWNVLGFGDRTAK